MADDLNTRLHADPLVLPRVVLDARMRARSPRVEPRDPLWLWLTGLGLLASVLLALVWPRARPHVPAPPPPAAPEPAPATTSKVRFSDGSSAELHGAASGLFTEEMSSERVRLRLTGGARFEVAPNPMRSFVVSNAQVSVRVLGTVFSIHPDGVRTRVAVEQGRAQVIWRNGANVMSAGEIALFPPESEPAF